jgi:hypothetical protein
MEGKATVFAITGDYDISISGYISSPIMPNNLFNAHKQLGMLTKESEAMKDM